MSSADVCTAFIAVRRLRERALGAAALLTTFLAAFGRLVRPATPPGAAETADDVTIADGVTTGVGIAVTVAVAAVFAAVVTDGATVDGVVALVRFVANNTRAV